jgi:DNA-3-methyladenine glycosylase II
MSQPLLSPFVPLAILSADPVLRPLIEAGPPIAPRPQQDLYFALLRSVISQQLSTKVARVITQRFCDLFPEQYPHPDLVTQTPDETLRQVGLSGQKLGYIRNIVAFQQQGELEHGQLGEMDDDKLIRHLTQIKGVGRWTAEMILMFALDRPDVLPVDDLGIRNAMVRHYGFSETGKALTARMVVQAEAWRPYRTLACKYLWQSLDNNG